MLAHTQLTDMPSAANADHDGRYLELTGGTLSGALDMGDNSILNLGDTVINHQREIGVGPSAGGNATMWFYNVVPDVGDNRIEFRNAHVAMMAGYRWGRATTGGYFEFTSDAVGQIILMAKAGGGGDFDLNSANILSAGDITLGSNYRASFSVGELVSPVSLPAGALVNGLLFWQSSSNRLWMHNGAAWRYVDTVAGSP